jgi:hypothetical protein
MGIGSKYRVSQFIKLTKAFGPQGSQGVVRVDEDKVFSVTEVRYADGDLKATEVSGLGCKVFVRETAAEVIEKLRIAQVTELWLDAIIANEPQP